MKKTAVQCAHEIMRENDVDACCICNEKPYTELHHAYGRGNRKYTGEILYLTIFPLCKECHSKDYRNDEFFKHFYEKCEKKDEYIQYTIKCMIIDLRTMHIQRMIAKGIKVFAE